MLWQMFLKSRIKEMTDLLYDMVPCITRQNHCCISSKNSLHDDEQIKNFNGRSVFSNDVPDDTDRTINQLVEHLNQLNMKEYDVTKKLETHGIINDQLIHITSEQNVPYDTELSMDSTINPFIQQLNQLYTKQYNDTKKLVTKEVINDQLTQNILEQNGSGDTVSINSNVCVTKYVGQLQQLDRKEHNDTKKLEIQETINDQLIQIRTKQKAKYELIKTSSMLTLKSRLEKIANYFVQPMNQSTAGDTDTDTSVTKKKKRNTVAILGDSMVKHIKGKIMAKSLKNQNVIVRSFSGATTKGMAHHIKPTIELEPETVIIHCGTNNLRSEQSPAEIKDEIINLAKNVKKDTNLVVISGIIPRNDSFNNKANQVNSLLQNECNSRNMPYISHESINPRRNLNRDRLHLNVSGTKQVVRNYINFLNSIYD